MKLFLLILLGWTFMDGFSQDPYRIIFMQDFENDTPGVYNRSQWRRDWNSPPYENNLENTHIVSEDDGNKVMKWIYPRGSVGPDQGGGQFEAPIKSHPEEIYMSYNIMFRPGFQWVEGGKLPGLGGGPAYGSGTAMKWNEGFSARLMWRYGKNAGKVMFYAYYQNKDGIYGAGWPWDNYVFQTDPKRWYNITIRLVMNSIDRNKLISDPKHAGNADGLMEGFIDGKLMTSVTGICFRNLPSIKIDAMHITSFFGGHTPNYAALRDEWALLDDVCLFTYTKDANVPHGNEPSSPGRVLDLPNMKDQHLSVSKTNELSIPAPGEFNYSDLSGTGVHLQWKPVENTMDPVSYRLYVNGKEAGTTAVNYYDLTELKPSTKYLITVTAFNTEGKESKHSRSLAFVTPGKDEQPPSVPSGLVISGKSDDEAVLAWKPSSDNIGVEGYRIYVNGKENGTSVATSYTVRHLNPGTKYKISVAAYDEASNHSNPSSSVSVTTDKPDTEPPSVPEGLTILPSEGESVTLKWNPSTDNTGVAGYVILRNGVPVGSTDQTSYVIRKINDSINDQIRISAYDAHSNKSKPSEPITIAGGNGKNAKEE